MTEYEYGYEFDLAILLQVADNQEHTHREIFDGLVGRPGLPCGTEPWCPMVGALMHMADRGLVRRVQYGTHHTEWANQITALGYLTLAEAKEHGDLDRVPRPWVLPADEPNVLPAPGIAVGPTTAV
jgi:hypothetical protein